MRQIALMGVAACLVLGCSQSKFGSYSGIAHADKMAREQARAGLLPPQYIEFAHDGRLYVVSTPAAQSKILAGDHLDQSVTKIAAGPNRETVIIEADKQYVESELVAQFNRKYGKTVTVK